MSVLSTTIEIAQEAAALAMSGFRIGTRIDKKGAIDLVTEYDVAAEKLIRARLEAAFPGQRVVGEELEDHGEGDAVWYVDPIDGTTNFAHGHPFFCTAIALFAEGQVQVGVVAAPALGIVWASERGKGATRNGVACSVSSTASLGDALCATGFPYDRWTTDDDNLREHRAFLKCIRGIRRCGSAAIDLCLVAEGTYDLYWEQRLNPWDMCAGALMVEEAGGKLSDYHGGPADPRTGQLVASNGPLHESALTVLGEARKSLS